MVRFVFSIFNGIRTTKGYSVRLKKKTDFLLLPLHENNCFQAFHCISLLFSFEYNNVSLLKFKNIFSYYLFFSGPGLTFYLSSDLWVKFFESRNKLLSVSIKSATKNADFLSPALHIGLLLEISTKKNFTDFQQKHLLWKLFHLVFVVKLIKAFSHWKQAWSKSRTSFSWHFLNILFCGKVALVTGRCYTYFGRCKGEKAKAFILVLTRFF